MRTPYSYEKQQVTPAIFDVNTYWHDHKETRIRRADFENLPADKQKMYVILYRCVYGLKRKEASLSLGYEKVKEFDVKVEELQINVNEYTDKKGLFQYSSKYGEFFTWDSVNLMPMKDRISFFSELNKEIGTAKMAERLLASEDDICRFMDEHKIEKCEASPQTKVVDQQPQNVVVQKKKPSAKKAKKDNCSNPATIDTATITALLQQCIAAVQIEAAEITINLRIKG